MAAKKAPMKAPVKAILIVPVKKGPMKPKGKKGGGKC